MVLIYIMDNETFMYLLSNQQKWAEEYRRQKRLKIKEHNKSIKDKNWYGNSKEYMKLWRRKGAMFNK